MADKKYDDYDWGELPKDIQEAFSTLGYTKKLWDADKDPPSADKYWKNLNAKEQAAAAKLGYTEDKWNSED